MITFYGYAVKKDGKYLGFNPKCAERDKLRPYHFRMYKYYKRPRFPVVNSDKSAQEVANDNLGKVVKVKLTMEEEGADNGK